MPPSLQSTSSSKIPSLLEPHILSGAATRDDGSLTVLTSVQGATSNWLVVRYLYALLAMKNNSEPTEEAGVLLVSFLRDGNFWKEGCLRMGLDLETASRSGRFFFVDGLTGLFSPKPTSVGGEISLSGLQLDDIASQIGKALAGLKTTKRVLIIDQIDTLLAVGGDKIDALGIQNLVLSLREHAFSTILTLAADTPLIHSQLTTLEQEHAAVVLGMAHTADEVLSLRKLDTGAAGDVSGVIRITSKRVESRQQQDGTEVLYHVGGDGAVKVFERGT